MHLIWIVYFEYYQQMNNPIWESMNNLRMTLAQE